VKYSGGLGEGIVEGLTAEDLPRFYNNVTVLAGSSIIGFASDQGSNQTRKDGFAVSAMQWRLPMTFSHDGPRRPTPLKRFRAQFA
tara:strand:+ start:7658 stop:7912 length:255 start_codon:yes stop_codon:yes gene_type:complete